MSSDIKERAKWLLEGGREVTQQYPYDAVISPLRECLEDALSQIESLERPWISVNAELPPPNQKETNDQLYLVWCEGDYDFAFFDGADAWDSPDNGWIKPTHWSKCLPEPPEQQT